MYISRNNVSPSASAVRNHCRTHPAPCVRPRCVLRAHAHVCRFYISLSFQAFVIYFYSITLTLKFEFLVIFFKKLPLTSINETLSKGLEVLNILQLRSRRKTHSHPGLKLNFQYGSLVGKGITRVRLELNFPIPEKIYLLVVVVLLSYVHGKHLRSCRDGQLT